jgi:BNR repeat-like domain
MRHSRLDPRHIIHGATIPSESYCDQPYIVKTDDGAWLCVITTGTGREGESGQHVVTMRSEDRGKTWSAPIAMEPKRCPENSYAVLLKTTYGRVYCFYNHNTDNIRELKADNPPYSNGLCHRVDSIGYYVFRFSDDHGRTWSDQRYIVPVREMDIDRNNVYGGKIRFFWNVGRPTIHDGEAFLSIHKVGGFGVGFFTRSQGVLVRSGNILTERDPAGIEWETLPDGEAGLRTPPGGGPISEEQSYCALSDGSLHCIYRTVDGHPVTAYSRDRGRHWTTPQYTTFGSGRRMKHPRAAVFAWRCSNGKYLCWFHNHGGKNYEHRNPAWVCGGEEYDAEDGKRIRWSEPEVLLYDDDPLVRMSYPDLVEEDGHYFITETQKNVGRLHKIPKWLLDSVWGQSDNETAVTEGRTLDLPVSGHMPDTASFLPLQPFVVRDLDSHDYGTALTRQGFSIELLVQFTAPQPNQTLLDTRGSDGRGLAVLINEKNAIELVMCDGRTESRWHCNPDLIQTDRPHHIVINVDGGPRIISFVIDGLFDDGGSYRPFGWGRFGPDLQSINTKVCATDLSDPELYARVDDEDRRNLIRIAPRFDGQIQALRIYDHCLLTGEAIGNYREMTRHMTSKVPAPAIEIQVGLGKPRSKPSPLHGGR